MAKQLLQTIVPQHWDSQTPVAGSGTQRVRFLQSISDLFTRPLNNRQSAATTAATAINTNGAVQSSGIGTPNPLQPQRYAEFTVKAVVTFSINSTGPAFVYVYRTLGAIPAKGAAPGAADVVVGGNSFMGGPTSNGVNQSGSFSFLDSGLDTTKTYNYYLAVKGPNGNALSIASNSQLLVMERS